MATPKGLRRPSRPYRIAMAPVPSVGLSRPPRVPHRRMPLGRVAAFMRRAFRLRGQRLGGPSEGHGPTASGRSSLRDATRPKGSEEAITVAVPGHSSCGARTGSVSRWSTI